MWCCWYLVLFMVCNVRNSLEMRHFNHLNGWLIVSSFASECKASAWKTRQRERERERERFRVWWSGGDDGRQKMHLSLHLWKDGFVSFHVVVSSLSPERGTTYSHHPLQTLLFIRSFPPIKAHIMRTAKVPPFKQNKNALQGYCIAFA